MLAQLPISRLTADPSVHARLRLRPQTVRDYLEISAERADRMPPLLAFRDSDGKLWLSDGFHRYYAWQQAGHENVPVEVLEGDCRAAILHACGANTEHGVPRTRNDKWAAVVAMLLEPDWAAQDDQWIAEKCAVSRTLVRQARQDCASFESLQDARGRRNGWDRKFQRKQAAQEAYIRALEASAAPRPSSARLSARDRAQECLFRAQAAAQGANRAIKGADRAYPEAMRMSAVAALSEARVLLAEILPPEPAAPPDNSNVDQAIAILSQFGTHAGEIQPATKQGRGTRGEGRVGTGNQPATKRGATDLTRPSSLAPHPSLQPATKQDEPPPQEWLDTFRQVLQGLEGTEGGDPFDRLTAPPPPIDGMESLMTLSGRREAACRPPPALKPPPEDLVRQKKKDRKSRERARRAAESSRRPP